jgi:hypothetical protein
VIFSAIFAEIIVSSIAMIAIVKEVTRRGFMRVIISLKVFISIPLKGFINIVNCKSAYLSLSKRRFGIYPHSERNQINIPTIQTTITIGKFGNFFLEKRIAPSQNIKVTIVGILIDPICLKVSQRFRYISLCCGILSSGVLSPRAPFI